MNFIGILDIQVPSHKGIPSESPVFILYKENENLSKHEILKRFNRILTKNEIKYIRPLENITGEWLFNLQEFKHSFDCLNETKYLKGKITIEPEYFQRVEIDEFSNEIILEETSIKFSIYPEDININNTIIDNVLFEEINHPLQNFRKDYGSSEKCGFLMMKFEDSKIQIEIMEIIKNHFKGKGIKILRADDKWYADDLLTNIKTYMHGCSFGVALFDRINTNYFNPNVSLEIGYMMAMNKPILFLKDSTLNSLHTDLIGKLYHEYDFQSPEKTLPLVIDKWVIDKEI